MPTDPNVHPDWVVETKRVAANLHRLDYYQVLGVGQNAPASMLKAKYHALQRNYHPDAFFSSPDADLRQAVTAIAKRITEAYVVLRDPEKRAKYTRDITGPERKRKLRYTDETAHEQRVEKQQEIGRTAQGRQLWTKAAHALRRGDKASAIRDLRTALIFERDNARFKEKLAELEASD